MMRRRDFEQSRLIALGLAALGFARGDKPAVPRQEPKARAWASAGH